jgi:hypothetical protein
MFSFKKHLANEYGRFSTEYALGISVLVIVVIAFWRTWCVFTIKLVNPIFSMLGSPGISTRYCNAKNIKLDLEKIKPEIKPLDFLTLEEIKGWIENIPLPVQNLIVIIAIIVMAATIASILVSQFYSKQNTIKPRTQDWHKTITNLLLSIWDTIRRKVRDWSEILLLSLNFAP